MQEHARKPAGLAPAFSGAARMSLILPIPFPHPGPVNGLMMPSGAVCDA
jgi:hypothetical protein